MVVESGSSIEMEQLQRAADILKTVAHPMRLQIIDALEGGEMSVAELCRLLGMPQPYASQQLNLMKNKGILSSRRSGNLVFYAVANPSVVKIIHCVRRQSGAGGSEEAACPAGSETTPGTGTNTG